MRTMMGLLLVAISVEKVSNSLTPTWRSKNVIDDVDFKKLTKESR